jgi:hypothetical protein
VESDGAVEVVKRSQHQKAQTGKRRANAKRESVPETNDEDDEAVAV